MKLLTSTRNIIYLRYRWDPQKPADTTYIGFPHSTWTLSKKRYLANGNFFNHVINDRIIGLCDNIFRTHKYLIYPFGVYNCSINVHSLLFNPSCRKFGKWSTPRKWRRKVSVLEMKSLPGN